MNKTFNNQFATIKLREEIEEDSVTGSGEAYKPSLNVPEKKYKGVSERIDTITLQDFKNEFEKFKRGLRRKDDIIAAYAKLSSSDQDSAKGYMRDIKENNIIVEDDLSGYKPVKGFRAGHTKDTGGFQYSDLWNVNEADERYNVGDEVRVTKKGSIQYNKIGTIDAIDEKSNMYKIQFKNGKSGMYHESDLVRPSEPKGPQKILKIDENYNRFKKETSVRSKEQQMHEAMKLVRKKLGEAEKVIDYVKTMKEELGLQEYKSHTNRLMEKLQVSISEIYKKYKSIK
jgi:hypothetical protein